MPSYDTSRYDPPAPIAQVTLRDQKSGALLPNISLLIDTGADVTLLPFSAAQRLGIQPIANLEYELLSFDDAKSTAQAVELDMVFLGRTFRGRYLLINTDQGILGRDILSAVALRLDGPRQQWSELAD